MVGVEPAGFSGRCTGVLVTLLLCLHPQGCLRRGPGGSHRTVGDSGSIPGSGRSPGGGHGDPLQCSCLENPRDGGAWWAAIYGVTQSRGGVSGVSSSCGARGGFLPRHDKESACNVGDPGSIPGSGRSPGEGNGNPFQ